MIAFGAFRFLGITNESVKQITMHENNLVGRENGAEKADPSLLIAFGLGNEPVDPTVGQFRLRLVSRNYTQTESFLHRRGELLEVLPCSSDEFCIAMFENHSPESLYIHNSKTSIDNFNSSNEIVLTFETCSG